MKPDTAFKLAAATVVASIIVISCICTATAIYVFGGDSEKSNSKDVLAIGYEAPTGRAFKVENRLKVTDKHRSLGQDGTVYYLHVIEMDKDDNVIRVSTIYELKQGECFPDVWYACDKTDKINLSYSLRPSADPKQSVNCSRKFTLSEGQLNMLILKSEEEYLDEMIDELSKKKKQ